MQGLGTTGMIHNSQVRDKVKGSSQGTGTLGVVVCASNLVTDQVEAHTY
jgi:hypothetical protein